MQQGFKSEHFVDENGNPAGGVSTGKGIKIKWQNVPLGRGAERIKPNGAFVEDVIAIAIDRIEFYQESKFSCIRNYRAIDNLKSALRKLNKRTADRERREVEGTHEK